MCSCSDGEPGRKTCLEDEFNFSDCQCKDSPKPPHAGRSGSGGKPSVPPVTSSAGRAGGASGESGAGSSGPDGPTPPASPGNGEAATSGGGGGFNGSAGSASMPPEPLPNGAAGEPAPEQRPEIAFDPADEATFVFDQSVVREYNIVIAPGDLANMNAKPSAEIWVPAMLEFDGTTHGPIMVRYKGSGGSFKAPCTTNAKNDPRGDGKCSIKLGFDQIDPEGKFYGLKKLNFHAVIQDRTFLHDRLGYSLFREMQVAAPRAMHAKVSINGEPEGLFVMVEQIDGRFSRARFSEGGEGNVYKEAWPAMDREADYIKALESNKDENPSVAKMLEFQNAVKAGPDEMAKYIDKDYLVRFFAVDRVIMNDDGPMHFYCDQYSPDYPGTSHNFYWYETQAYDRRWIIPWDLDLAFDATPYVHVNPAWYDSSAACVCTRYDQYGWQTPPACDPLVKNMIAWRADYEREVDAFIAGPFSEARVEAKLEGWIEQIRPYIREFAGVKRSPMENEWDGALREFRAKLASAREHRGFPY